MNIDYPDNSLFYWYPLIKDLGIPMPKTVMVPMTGDEKEDRYQLFNGKEAPLLEKYMLRLQENAKSMELPLFLRSDETSNKHGWENTCFVSDIEQIPHHAYQIIEFTEMAGWLGGLDINGFVLREFLELDTRFTAFHGKMPVAKEFRFFVKDGKYQCYHPYWFPACMVKPSIEDWYDELLDMENISEAELEQLIRWTEKIGNAVDGYWSVDFCQLLDKTWAMTDMAIGENSFHWVTCKYAEKGALEHYGDPYAMPKEWRASIRSDSVGLCSWCGGSGQLEKTNHQGEYPQKYDCPVCNGTGKEPIKSDKKRSKQCIVSNV